MKKIIMTLQNSGGSYALKVIGDPDKKDWGKLDERTVIDYEAAAIAVDAKKDGYKIIIIRGEVKTTL